MRADWIEGRPQPVDAARIASDIARYAAFASRRSVHLHVVPSKPAADRPPVAARRACRASRRSASTIRVRCSTCACRSPTTCTRSSAHSPSVRAAWLCGARRRRTLAYRALPLRDRSAAAHYIAVQPGASVPARAWDPHKLRALVARLRAGGEDVILLGSDEERELDALRRRNQRRVDWAGTTTYAEFAAVVRDARALIVGNTSGLHVAGAVGTPVVTIFPPTIPSFASRRGAYRMLRSGDQTIACAGCRARTCPIPAQPCTGCVGVDDVDRRATDPRRAVNATVLA